MSRDNTTMNETESGDMSTADTHRLEYENVTEWKEWHREVAEDLSVVLPKGATADITVSVELDERSTEAETDYSEVNR